MLLLGSEIRLPGGYVIISEIFDLPYGVRITLTIMLLSRSRWPKKPR